MSPKKLSEQDLESLYIDAASNTTRVERDLAAGVDPNQMCRMHATDPLRPMIVAAATNGAALRVDGGVVKSAF